ncbi:hypothetical protein IMG5_119850 [Ichthyophthirius multifiliis]|uniref:TmcB/TmcC TPR repeats domain-containing protein n=1 Tax=Ichthyophthirius multifiliis TaxID=5932 RepID=G0QUW5_ICHMU|nr:hypothetical protein IMG5_119850 [Ichthyophthirius multifiliis]EGR30970.1 hypothetical protein IMG5_119850 [Ichthyophthirius multifiliis]|eukprot:XP_004034453.1 hypothetical protein IMG5_119850 [Ichthyophthirius multifiliis]
MNQIQYDDDDKSSLEKMQDSLKFVIFEILYHLINQGDSFSFIIYVIFIFIETFQIFFWYFTTDVIKQNNQNQNQYKIQIKDLWIIVNLANSLEKFFGYFLIVPQCTSFDQLVVAIYAIIGIFSLMLFLILYVSCKIKNGITGLSGAISIIKVFSQRQFLNIFYKNQIFCQIILPILYLPFFDLFLSIMRCKPNDQGQYMHKIFVEVQCYQGNNLLHSFFAGVAALLLFFVTYLATITNFESRYISNRIIIKQNKKQITIFLYFKRLSGRDDIKMMIFKTFLVLGFTYLDTSDLLILILISITANSMNIFLAFNKSSNILNYMYNKVTNSQAAVIFWTTLITIFGQIMVFTDFKGVAYIWFIGIPFLISIVFLRREYRYDLMMVDSNKFDSLNQAISQILYLTRCLNYYNSDRNIAAILDGFVDYHRTICNREDCPCQQKNMNQKKIKKFIKNAKAGQFDDEIKDKFVVLVYLIERIFVLALTKFPGCTQLRVNHALFLLDKMKSAQQALQELELAQEERPYLDEQFQIFRYKKLIEDNMMEARKNTVSNKNNNENVNEITSDSGNKELINNIEQSTALHMDFWSQLSEDTPDLCRVYEIGTKLNYYNQLVKDSWKKQNRINSDISPNLLRTYARYLLDVLNDKEQAFEVIQKYYNPQILKTSQGGNIDRSKTTNNINDFQNESTGLISISAEDVSFARISALNQTAAMYFGYSKSELINRKINHIMPQQWAEQHDSFIEDYLHHLESKVLNKERLLFGKQKNGYIFPSYMYIRYVPSYLHGTQFIATVRIEKYFKLVAYMTTNKSDLEITNITPNCISLFELSLGILNKKKPSIIDLIPEFNELLPLLKQKGGHNIQLTATLNQAQNFNIQVKEISFRGNKVILGYEIRFEKIIKDTPNMFETNEENQQNTNQLSSARAKKNNISSIQYKLIFRYDYENHQFNGENTANIQMCKVDNSLLYQNNTQIDSKNIDIAMNFSTHQIDQSNREKDFIEEQNAQKLQVDYGKGIRAVRLIRNQLVDVEDMKRDEQDGEEEEEEQGQQFEQCKQQVSQLEYNESESAETNVFKNKQKLVQILNENKSNSNGSLEIFKWSGVVILLILGIIAIINYISTQNQFNLMYSCYDLVAKSNIRQSLVQRILFKLYNYRLVNYGLYPVFGDTLSIDQSDLDNSIQELQQIQQELFQSSNSMQADQISLYSEQTVIIKSSQQGEVKELKVDINQATLQFISASLNLRSGQIDSYVNNNQMYFIEYNALNEYYLALKQSANYYVEDLVDYIQSKSETYITYLIISIIFCVLSFCFITPIFSFVSKNQETVLKLFLEIPVAQIKQFYSKCEQFQNGMQLGEDDNVSELDEIIQEEEDSVEGISRKRKKRKFKWESIDKRNFIIKFLLSLILLEGYFIATYFVSTSLQNSLASIVSEMNSTCQSESYYTFANNALRKTFLDQEFSITAQKPEFTINNIMMNLNEINTNMHTEHAKNIVYHTSTYNSYFESVNDLNACIIIQELLVKKQADCEAFANSIIKEGLGLAIIRHFENIRYVITLYNNFLKDPNAEFPAEENIVLAQKQMKCKMIMQEIYQRLQ